MGKVTEIATEYREGRITIDQMASRLADAWAPTPPRRNDTDDWEADLDGVNQSTIFLLTAPERAALNDELDRRG